MARTLHLNYVTERGNSINTDPPNIKRVIPLEEVTDSKHYWDMAELAVIFNHEIVEMDDDKKGKGTWRWKPNRFIDWIHSFAPVYTPSDAECFADGEAPYVGPKLREFRASLNLNMLVMDLHRGIFTMEEWMKFYMQIGYSLSGYGEVFGQHEAAEYQLPDAKRRTDADDPNQYVETVLDYMRRVHKGKVLKL